MPQSVTWLHRAVRRVWASCFGWRCLFLLTTISASALDVQQTKWGFDGQVVSGRFNVFSALVINMSSVPFDGKIAFNKNRGMEERVGAVNELPCYLSPHSSRWVQFYVFVGNQYDHWRLTWGKSPKESLDFDPPKLGNPAQVFLLDAEAAFSAGGAFKLFPEELFPSTVAATSGLDSVLLDHAPHWELPKRKAFLNWLQAGGRVHLLLNAEGRYPVFQDELNVLNFPESQLSIGSGMAVRHAGTIRELRKNDVSNSGYQPVSLDRLTSGQITDSLLMSLSRMSQRQYNWGGIYALGFLYLALVGPGIFYHSRKWMDYRLKIALLLATVATFSIIFNWVGRRNQGETSVVHSLSYARAIEGDDYDVMQWGNIFAVHGAYYSITHDAPHNLYATGQEYEPVNGVISNGKDGRFVVDIPMFSRRTYLHSAEMKGAGIPVQIVRWNGGQKLKQLAISIGEDFSKQVLGGWMVSGDQIYTMKLKNGGLEFEDADKEPYENFVAVARQLSSSMAYGGTQGKMPPDSEDQFQKLAKALIPWSLGPDWASSQAAASEKRVQLFLFARSPKSFSIRNSGLGSEVGYVLYHFVLALPEKEGKT